MLQISVCRAVENGICRPVGATAPKKRCPQNSKNFVSLRGRKAVAISSSGYAPHHPHCHCEAVRPWQSPGTILDKICTKGAGRAKQVPSTFRCAFRYIVPGDSHGPTALGMTYRYIFLLVVTAQWSLRWRAGQCPAPTEQQSDKLQFEVLWNIPQPLAIWPAAVYLSALCSDAPAKSNPAALRWGVSVFLVPTLTFRKHNRKVTEATKLYNDPVK